jgi:hypothetical protein
MRFVSSIIVLITLFISACVSQEFAGDAGVRKQAKRITPLPPPVTEEKKLNEDLKTDDGGLLGEIPGQAVEKVGIGFEDWTDMDFNGHDCAQLDSAHESEHGSSTSEPMQQHGQIV